MRALQPEVFDAVWAAVEPLLPAPPMTHPLGCHRRRAPDRICFQAMLIRLVTGCSWIDVEALVGRAVSDTTLRTRRDEWERAGVFDVVAEEALTAYDKIIGADLSEAAVDGSQHKAPRGGEGTGPNPVDREERGWKWSLLTDRAGIPFGWATDGASATTSLSSAPPWRRASAVAWWPTSRPCTSTAAMTAQEYGACAPATGSTTSSPTDNAGREDNAVPLPARRSFPSACAGRWSGPTPGW